MANATNVPVPTLTVGAPEARELLRRGEPVVLKGAQIVPRALVERWSAHPAVLLADAAGDDRRLNALESASGEFRYWAPGRAGRPYAFVPPTVERRVSAREAVERLERAAEAEKSGAPALYVQHVLDATVGEALQEAFLTFGLDTVAELQQAMRAGPLTTNTLLVGPPGAVTPAHYDEQANLFCQVAGLKRVRLWSPVDYAKLYPFPLAHPHDRQSRVDALHPDLAAFPLFADAPFLECVLEPGDVLYIPSMWWHHLTLEGDGLVASINWWMKAPSVDSFGYDDELADGELAPMHVATLSRNVERIISGAVGPRRVPDFLAAVARLHATGEAVGDAFTAALAQLREALEHVLPAGRVLPFLAALLPGRFDGLEAVPTEQPPSGDPELMG